MEKTEIQSLINKALEARESARCFISGFGVGAALLAENDVVYQGCNVEISGMSSSCCAERVAVFKAVSEGNQTFKAVAIVGGKMEVPLTKLCPPCGTCRQVMADFVDPKKFMIIMATDIDNYKTMTMEELLPFAYTK